MDIRIDTLRLQAAGMDSDTGRRFARLVAERLDAALAIWPAGAGQARLGGLHVAVRTGACDSPDDLAASVAAEISRVLSLASVPGARAMPARQPLPARPATGPRREAMT